MILKTEFGCVCKEVRYCRLTLRGDGNTFAIHSLIGSKALSINHKLRTVIVKTREKALSHKTLSPELVITCLEGKVSLEAAEVERSVTPDVSLSDIRIVVITKLVALTDNLRTSVGQIVIQVVLDHCLIGSEVTLGKLVDVHIIATSEKIIEFLVVLSAVPLIVDTSGERERIACIPLHISAKIDVILVYAALLKNILRTCYAVGIEVVPVHVVESIPVKVGIFRDILFPCILSPCSLFSILAVIVLIIIPEVAGKVAIIVRTWVWCVIPVKSCVTILTCSPKHRTRSLQIISGGGGILKYGNRLECLADTRITNLAVLITPVRVIHVVAHQVINLLSRCILRTTLSGSCECHEAEAVDIIELLLNTCIVCEITVEDSLHPVVSSDTCRYGECI